LKAVEYANIEPLLFVICRENEGILMSNVQNQTELERQPGIQRNTMSVAVAGNTVNEAGADTTN